MRCGLVHESLQVAAGPCWEEALPDVLSSIYVEVLGPVPRRASSVPLPVSSRRTSASPHVQEVQRAETPAITPPCGAPIGVGCHWPSSTTPACSHWRISFHTLRSLIRRATNRLSSS